MSYHNRTYIAAAILIFASILFVGLPLKAQTCTVPGSYASIQEAINDPACATITLSAQTYAESIAISRSLTLAGPGTGGAIVQGLVQVSGPGTEVNLNDLKVENGCSPNALSTAGGAKIIGNNLLVERSAALPCPALILIIFTDGFETGDTSTWSMTVP